MKIRTTIQNAFFNYGWLLPLLLPTAQVMGRGVTNTLWAVYLAWALVAMVGAQTRIPRNALAICFALPIAFLCGVLAAEDIGAALHSWVKFTLHSLVFLFTLVALASRPQAAQRMLRCAGYAGLLLVTVWLVALCWQVTQPGFVPALILREDNLPFLTPFILALVWNTADSRTRLAVMVITTLIISGYVLYSGGRAAPLVSGLLNFSYTLRQFAFYLPILLAALWHLSAHVPKVDRQADKHRPCTDQESVIGTT